MNQNTAQKSQFTARNPDYKEMAKNLNYLESHGLSGNHGHDGYFYIKAEDLPREGLLTFAEMLANSGAQVQIACLTKNRTGERLLAQRILDRELTRGEWTQHLNDEIAERFSGHLLLIDHAEFLEPRLLISLVYAMRSMARMIIMIVHDTKLFERHMTETGQPFWLTSRCEQIKYDAVKRTIWF